MALGFRTRRMACLLGFLAFAAAQPAAAETLTVMWDPSAGPDVAGYVVYIRMPGMQGTSYDVGQTTSYDWNGAINGQQYYFSVAAYSAGPVLGVRSAEISRYPDSAPTLANPGNLSSVVGASVSFQLVGSDPEGAPLNYAATGLPPGLQLAAATGQIAGSPSTAGSYVVTASVTDGALSAARTFTWTIVQSPSPSPAGSGSATIETGQNGVSVEQPASTLPAGSGPTLNNPGPQTASRGTAVVLQLTAQDSNGASVHRFGASGLPPGLRVEAGNGEISGSPSTPGNYLVTATVTDGTLSDAKTFTWTIIQSAIDSTAPLVTITLPTAASSYATDQAFVTLGGTAIDDGLVAEVVWSSDRGGQGKASGTDNWIAGIPVQRGTNIITIRARDEAGNTATRAIVVKARIAGTISEPGVVQRGRRAVDNSN